MSKTLPDSWIEGNKESIQAFQGGNILIMLIAVIICAPIAEELIFRGLIYNALKKIINLIPKVSSSKTRLVSMLLSAVISSALFGIYHGNILQGLYTGFLSLFMVFVYEISGSLFSSMIVHAAFNFAGLPTAIFTEEFGMVPSIVICSIMTLVVVIFVLRFKKRKTA
jgi:membrane protease YdiL (CAAX protease family)